MFSKTYLTDNIKTSVYFIMVPQKQFGRQNFMTELTLNLFLHFNSFSFNLFLPLRFDSDFSLPFIHCRLSNWIYSFIFTRKTFSLTVLLTKWSESLLSTVSTITLLLLSIILLYNTPVFNTPSLSQPNLC